MVRCISVLLINFKIFRGVRPLKFYSSLYIVFRPGPRYDYVTGLNCAVII